MSVSDHPLDRLIDKLAMRVPLSPPARAALLALPYSVRNLEPGGYVLHEGDRPATCTALLSGFAFRRKLTGEGARQIVSLHVPGEALDLQNLFLDVADHSVQMLTRGELVVIPRAPLRELVLANPEIASAVHVDMLVDASIFREWVLNIGRRDARARVAHLLCEFAVRLDALGLAGRQGYHLPMSQEQLADAVGLTPVHVNRTLRGLEEEGLLARDRREISFPQWEALRAVAEFDRAYLHLDQRG